MIQPDPTTTFATETSILSFLVTQTNEPTNERTLRTNERKNVRTNERANELTNPINLYLFNHYYLTRVMAYRSKIIIFMIIFDRGKKKTNYARYNIGVKEHRTIRYISFRI